MIIDILKRKLYYLLSLFFTLCASLVAQEQVATHNFVNIQDGVSNIAISTIIQDQYGFIWMGTNGVGLNRFDGKDYSIYKHVVNDSTSISSSLIFCSYIDSKERLWIGTEDGLNLYVRDLNQFKQIPFYDSNSIINLNFQSRRCVRY